MRFAVELIGSKDGFAFAVVRQSGHIMMSDGRRRLTIPCENPANVFPMCGIANDAGLSP